MEWLISFISIMKWKLILPLALGVFIFCWMFLSSQIGGSPFHRHSQQDVIQQIFTSSNIFNVVMTSPQVTAQILTNDPEDGFPILAGDNKYKPVILSPDQAKIFKELLAKPSSYVWGIMSGCTVRYGVVFDFRSGSHTVRVAFCFQCHMMGVFDGDGENAKEITDYVLSDPMRKQLTALCKTLFPDDPKIQALK
jgi:hypothetical protein